MDLTPPNHLPPIDASGLVPEDQEADCIAYVGGIDLECYESLNGMPGEMGGQSGSWLSLADDSQRIYELGDIDGVTPVYANDIQNAVIAITDRQSREATQSSIEPVSVGDSPVVFWVGPPGAAAQFGLDPVYVQGAIDPETGQQIDPPPIPQQMLDQLPPEAVDNEKMFVKVNAEVIAEVNQSFFDVTWQRSRLDQWFRSNSLQNNISGWRIDLYEFDHQTKKAEITELSVHQTRIDPTVSTLSKAAYAGAWLLVDQNWAFRKYPKLAAIIEAESRLGNPLPWAQTNPLAELMSVNFRRKMVVMQLWWFRNQFIKLTPDEAVASGQVQIGMVPDVSNIPQQVGGDSGPDALRNGDSTTQPETGADNLSESETGGAPASGESGRGTGSGILQETENHTQTRQAFIHSQTGQEIDPSHELWPFRLGLGRMCIINGHIAEWVEEKAWDIPLLHNVCIPVTRKPWGIGEPYRLLNMQRAYNRVWGSMVDHCDWNAHPPALMSESMHAATTNLYKEAKVKPGVTIIVDDPTYQANGGKLDVTQPLAPLAPHLPEMEARMSQKLSESSGNNSVLQGQAPASQAKSGKAIELLQVAGESTIGFKSQNSGDMVYWLDRLILHDIARSYTVDDAMKVVKKYPRHVMQYILDQSLDTEMDFTVSIAGGGTMAQAKRLKDQNDLEIGAISMETYRDRNNIDHKQEEGRIAQQNAGKGDPPSTSINYKDLPPEGKAQLAREANIQLTPQDIMAQQVQEQQQKQPVGGRFGSSNGNHQQLQGA